MSTIRLDLQPPTSILISIDDQPFYTIAYNQESNTISMIPNDAESVTRTVDINWLLDNAYEYMEYVIDGRIGFRQLCQLLDYDVYLINTR